MVVSSDYATVIIWLGFFALTFLVWAMLARRVVHRQFWCPWKKTEVDVDFTSSRFTGKYADVLSCSVFGKDKAVNCGKRCLNMFLPERFQLKCSYRDQKKEGSKVESARDVKRWQF
jgi:hypothetical protein